MFRTVLLLAIALAAPAGAAGSTRYLTSVERLASRIWDDAPKDSVTAQLVRQMQRHVAVSDWKAAIGVAERLAQRIPRRFEDYEKESPSEWRVAIGELYLYDLEPERAINEFERVLKAIPPAEWRYLRQSRARQSASYAMARAKAELGEFAEAMRWLKRAPDEHWSRCGNCQDAEQLWAHPMLVVWTKARLPYERAVPELEAIILHRFTPMKARLSSQKEAAEEQTRHAMAEASLILGELHLRHGQIEKARACFARAAASKYEVAHIARSYLRRRLYLAASSRVQIASAGPLAARDPTASTVPSRTAVSLERQAAGLPDAVEGGVFERAVK